MLLQIGAIPDPSTIKDANTALLWVVMFLALVVVAMFFFVKTLLKNQQTQYETQIDFLKESLAEAEKEKKELNEKLSDSIVPTLNDLNIALGKILEQNRKA